MKQVWLNGHIVPPEAANISLFDHGLLYGDGVFEGIRFYNNTAFQLDAHLQRLAQSAKAIGLRLPYSASELSSAVRSLIKNSLDSQGYMRMVVTRGVGPLGLDPSLCGQPNCFILVDNLCLQQGLQESVQGNLAEKSRMETGIRLVISSVRKIPNECLDSRIKSLNYLNLILAKMEASQAGAHEALLLNSRGFIAEGSAENIFIVKDSTLFTPPISDGALDGITRRLIIQLAKGDDIPVLEKSLTPYDVVNADECFLCGTGAELIPVASINGAKVGDSSGDLFHRIKLLFQNLIVEQTANNG